mgnify:FL=1
MSDPTLTADPNGTIHASIEVELPGETPPPDEQPEQPEQPASEATDVIGDIIVGAAKAAGKVAGAVLGTAWDLIKPSEGEPQQPAEEPDEAGGQADEEPS